MDTLRARCGRRTILIKVKTRITFLHGNRVKYGFKGRVIISIFKSAAMKTKTVDQPTQAASTSSSKRQAYKAPVFRIYGAVHQFTQGSIGMAADGGLGMTMMA